MNEIGNYIKKLRKERGLTQQQLAEKLFISFQAVSKWETGETLPETGILLKLCDILDTTADKLLNGGTIINKSKKLIKVENIVLGFKHIEELKHCFGKDSMFYRGVIEGISNKMNFDFEEALYKYKEVLYAEVIIQYLMNGYEVDIEEVKLYIKNDKYISEIKKRINK